MGILQMIREKKAELLKARDAKLDQELERLKPELATAKKAEKVRMQKRELRKIQGMKYREAAKSVKKFAKKVNKDRKSGGGFGSGLGAGGPFDTGGVYGKPKPKKMKDEYVTVKIKK